MSGIAGLLPLIIMIAIFYFLLIRPQQKRQREVKEMQDALQKGDDVITIGGLHGIIDVIDEDTVTIICENETKLQFDRAAIREVKNADNT